MTEQKQQFIPNEGKGNLFKNEFKEEGTAQPDYRGDCMIGGVHHEMAAWIKTSANGKRFMSFNFQPKNQQAAPARQAAPAAEDTDLPF